MKSKYIFWAVLLFFTGCVSLEQYPTDAYTDVNYWQSEENVRAALNKAYSQCWTHEYYMKNNIISDDAYGSRHAAQEQNIAAGIALTDNKRFSDEWNACYEALRTVHTVLDNSARIDIGDEEMKTRILAELRYIRAFSYLRLVTWFGNVPFYTTNPTLTESQTVTPTSSETIMKFIHSELDEISRILPKNTDLPESEKGRYTCGAAVALNARAYLLENDFESCAAECKKLIYSDEYGTYALASDYDALFNKHRGYENEAIMTVEYAIGGSVDNILRGWSTSNVVPVSVGNSNVWISPTQELVDCYLKLDGTEAEDTDYENRDKRFYSTIAYNKCQLELPQHGNAKVIGSEGTGKGIYTCYTNPEDESEAQKTDPNLSDSYNGSEDRTLTGYYNRKNYDPETIMSGGLSYKALIEIRYADVLLMYAESEFETGHMDEIIWNKTIRPLRQRAGFEESYLAYPSLTADGMRTQIRNERRCELAMEGRRVFDLRRWALLDNPTLKTEGSSIMNMTLHGAPFGDNNSNIVCPADFSMKYWFAIPQSERDINDRLTQNPGW